jgi:hypothetical protein
MEQLGTPTTAGLSKLVETAIAEGMLTTVGTPQQELQGGYSRRYDSSTRDNWNLSKDGSNSNRNVNSNRNANNSRDDRIVENTTSSKDANSNRSVDVGNNRDFSHTRDSWDSNSKKIKYSSRDASKPETIRIAGTQGKSTATIRSATSESVATKQRKQQKGHQQQRKVASSFAKETSKMSSFF